MQNSYFPHDSNARNSDKLLPVRMKYGAEGYGIYFMLLERLRDEPTYTSIKDYNILAFDLRVDAQKIKAVIEDFGLFAFTDDGKCFYSEGFMKRMKIKDSKSKARSNAGKKGAEKRWNEQKNGKAMAKPSLNNGKAMAKPYQNDGKESKVKESKVKKSKVKQSKEIETPAVAFQKTLTVYQQNIGVLNPFVHQNIEYRINDFVNQGTNEIEANEIVRLAIEKAALSNKLSWNYADGILKSWLDHSLFTLSNVKAEQKPKTKNEPYSVDESDKLPY